MIKSITFQDFKALRQVTLPLGPCTLLVGPNGSGKTTALQAFEAVAEPSGSRFSSDRIVNAVAQQSDESHASIVITWEDGTTARSVWNLSQTGRSVIPTNINPGQCQDMPDPEHHYRGVLSRIRIFSLDAKRIAQDCELTPRLVLSPDGYGLAGVLDHLRDHAPERFDDLNKEFHQWLPEFDHILFNVPSKGHRALSLRTSQGHHEIPASELSHGTLFALAILSIAYLPECPPLVGFEEPDHGIHPRPLRRVQDAIYRLCYPDSCGEKREPVQVIATTHSPYFLDLFKDYPEDVVIAYKNEEGVHFDRLSDKPRIHEILGDAPLGAVWYSGILGGVPAEQ